MLYDSSIGLPVSTSYVSIVKEFFVMWMTEYVGRQS